MFHDILGLERALPWLSLALVIGYLVGTLPTGLAVARAFGLGDLRRIGSGNTGATNVLRTGNKGAAALTLALDVAKGLVPAWWFLGWGDLAAQGAGLGAVLGHCFPVWLGFRGGKGVATGLGVLLALGPVAALAALATWIAAVTLSRRSSVGALAATATAPAWLAAVGAWEAVLCACALAVLIWLTHLGNIRRLIAGTEPRIGEGGGARPGD